MNVKKIIFIILSYVLIFGIGAGTATVVIYKYTKKRLGNFTINRLRTEEDYRRITDQVWQSRKDQKQLTEYNKELRSNINEFGSNLGDITKLLDEFEKRYQRKRSIYQKYERAISDP